MKRYTAMLNHTNRVDHRMLGKSACGTTQMVWIYESSATVCDKTPKLCESMKTQQEYVRPRAGKDRVGISYNAMMSIHFSISKISTP